MHKQTIRDSSTSLGMTNDRSCSRRPVGGAFCTLDELPTALRTSKRLQSLGRSVKHRLGFGLLVVLDQPEAPAD
jgi:hypothetical protein